MERPTPATPLTAGIAPDGVLATTADSSGAAVHTTRDRSFSQALATVYARAAETATTQSGTVQPQAADATAEGARRVLAGLASARAAANHTRLADTAATLSRGYAADDVRTVCAATVSHLYSRLADL